MTKGYYKTLGDFQAFEARRLLVRFEEENVRFQVDRNDGDIKNIDPVTASTGGAWGSGSTLRIYVHTSDQEKAGKIFAEIYRV